MDKKEMIQNNANKNTEHNEEYHILSSSRPNTIGWITILMIFGLFGLWAVFVKVDTTVLAQGKVISKGYKKTVKHPSGGIITKIYVKDGDLVKKGDPLLAIDSIDIESQLSSAIRQHDDLLAQKARLEAESTLSKKPNFGYIKDKMINIKRSSILINKEKALFNSDNKKLNLRIKLLKDKNGILTEQINGLKNRIESSKKLLYSYEKELKKWESLYDQNMTDELKVLELQRKIEQIRSDIESSESKIIENLKTIKANENQIELEKATFIDDARVKLKELTLKINMLTNKIKSLNNAKENMLIKAPDSGTIVDMSIHAPGEVVAPHRPIMYIVPSQNSLMLEIYIAPTDIDKVHIGQKADINFPSYVDPSAVPIEGKVTYISADTILPEGSKQSFYKALVEITPKGIQAIKENGFQVIPGMPASVYIKAGKRSFLSYILMPLQSLAKGAFHAN